MRKKHACLATAAGAVFLNLALLTEPAAAAAQGPEPDLPWTRSSVSVVLPGAGFAVVDDLPWTFV